MPVFAEFLSLQKGQLAAREYRLWIETCLVIELKILVK